MLRVSDPMPATADVVVVGAGLVGLCTALSLRKRGASRIVVVDRTSVCGAATGASAGGLWPGHECLTMASPELIRRANGLHVELREQFACDYVPSGLLLLLDETERSAAVDRVERTRRAGFEAELLSGRQLAECEPGLGRVAAAVRFPGDGSLHPLKLAAAMARWLRRNGVRICLDQEVHQLEPARLAILTSGGRMSAGSIVVAAGAWTPMLTKLLGWTPPIRPIRGALLATGAQAPDTLRSVVVGRHYYFWQLACGPVAGGGSEEDVGFLEGVCEAVVRDIRREFGELFPTLRDLQFTSRWSGFRPHCADMRPVIGRVPGQASVYVSAGHFRKGILLAPLSGELLADEMLEGRHWPPAQAFRPDRFPRATGTE